MSISYPDHLERVRDAMREWRVDLILFPFGSDLTYVTGLEPPLYYGGIKSEGDWVTGLIFGLDQDPTLILHRGLAVGNVEDRTWIEDIRVLPEEEDPRMFLASILDEFQPVGKTIAVTKKLWAQTLIEMQSAAPGARFVSATDVMMDKVRSIKDEEEIVLMRRAAEITDQVLEATLKRLRIGMTEYEVATEVVYQIRRHGGDDYSFYPGIICVGNDSDPNREIMTRNTDMALEWGTTVAFDFGVRYKGYCSDFGRSVFVGEPSPSALAAYRCITSGAQAIMAEMGDGKMKPYETHQMMQALAEEAGFGDWYYKWGLGHGIGLDVHEWPWLRAGYNEPIRSGMCFTVEPKIWKPGEFYVRSEDVVLVGEERAESLTQFHYEPNILE